MKRKNIHTVTWGKFGGWGKGKEKTLLYRNWDRSLQLFLQLDKGKVRETYDSSNRRVAALGH